MNRFGVLSCLSALMFVGCASSLPRADEVITRAQLEPLQQLPQDAAFYLRVSPRGWQELRVTAGSFIDQWTRDFDDHDRAGASLLDLRLLLALRPLLDGDTAVTGLAWERPLFFAIHSVDSAELEQVVSLGGIVKSEELPAGVLSSVLLPTSNADALVRSIEGWWTDAAVAKPGVRHQVRALDGWVRLDIFGGRGARHDRLDDAFARALARSAGTPLRSTPALAAFVTQPADLGLYVPLDQLRRVVTVSFATRVDNALTNLNPTDVAGISAAAASELYAHWVMLDPVGSEFEDVGMILNVEPGSDLQVDVVTTLTELGRRIAARTSGPQSLPRMKEGPVALDLRASMGPDAGDVPSPAVSALLSNTGDGRGPRDELDLLWKITEPWGYLAIARAPRAWMRLYSTVDSESGKAALGMTGIHVRIAPPPDGDFLRGWPKTPVAAILKFPTGAAADRFMLSMRGAQSVPGAALERLSTEADGTASVFGGLNVTASGFLLPNEPPQVLPAGISVAVSPELLRLFDRPRAAADSMSSIFAAGPMRLEVLQQETVTRMRMSLGVERPAIPEVRAFAFEPITHRPEDSCRATIAAHFARINEMVAVVVPREDEGLTRELEALDAVTACANGNPALAAVVRSLKERTLAVFEEVQALHERARIEEDPTMERREGDPEQRR